MNKINGTTVRVLLDGKTLMKDFYCDYFIEEKQWYITAKCFLTDKAERPFVTGSQNLMNNEGLIKWYNRLGNSGKKFSIEVAHYGNKKTNILFQSEGYLYSVKVIAKVEEAVIIHLKFKNI